MDLTYLLLEYSRFSNALIDQNQAFASIGERSRANVIMFNRWCAAEAKSWDLILPATRLGIGLQAIS